MKISKFQLVRMIVLSVVAVLASMLFSSNAMAAPSNPIYVALGDSFAAGQGSGFNAEDQSVYEAGTTASGNECFRASSAYPSIVAKNNGYTLINATCGGAITDDILGSSTRTTAAGNTFTIPAQIDSVPPNANVVSITIGGNDAQFIPFVACVFNTFNPNPPCTEQSAATIATRAAITSLQAKVSNVINAVKAKAPGANVLVTGYPQVVAGGPGCPFWLSSAENTLSNDINLAVNAEIHKAADASGAVYVDFYKQGGFVPGSDACSLAPHRKINGATVLSLPAAFHPNNQGQWAMAALVGAVA